MSESGGDSFGKPSVPAAMTGAATATRRPGVTIGGGRPDSKVKVLQFGSFDGTARAYRGWAREVEIAVYLHQVVFGRVVGWVYFALEPAEGKSLCFQAFTTSNNDLCTNLTSYHMQYLGQGVPS
jgi:hypothetical protein